MSGWKLLLDQNIRSEVRALPRAAGHDAVRCADVGLQRATDLDILQWATAQGRSIVTLDKDFGSLNIFPLPSSHAGVIRLKLDLALPDLVVRILSPFLNRHSQHSIDSSLVILSKNKARKIRT
jgi:predicted nuclease of predicted toxin-antitoxin system